MKSFYLLMLALVILGCNSAKFNIASSSTCTSTSAAGFCTKWQQNGTVEQQTAACFPQSMIVLTRNGYKTFDQLTIGDQILSYDRAQGQIYTQVRGWFHRNSSAQASYLSITFENDQSLLVSQKHNIAFTSQDFDYGFMFADEAATSDQLFGSANNVKSIKKVYQKGMYAPMTKNNNYFVFTSKQTSGKRILAHDYANLENPQSYEPIGNLIISAYQYFNSQQQSVQDGIHPMAEWLMSKFSFILE